MRTIPSSLNTHIQGDTLTLATLILIERLDGVKLGFTNADAPITYGGNSYLSADGMGTTAVQQTAGTGVDNMDIMGVLSDSRLTESDLDAGLYDGAKITITVVNRSNIAGGGTVLLKGYLGEVNLSDGVFKTEVRSLSQRLKMSVGDTSTPTCRCRRLGDLQCKVNLTSTALNGFAITATRTVSVVGSDHLTLTFASDSAPTSHYKDGLVTFTSGLNAGLKRDVKAHTKTGSTAVVELRAAFPYAVSAGDTATLQAGCDRLFATCSAKFGNANNFHGEERLPTNDKIGQVARK